MTIREFQLHNLIKLFTDEQRYRGINITRRQIAELRSEYSSLTLGPLFRPYEFGTEMDEETGELPQNVEINVQDFSFRLRMLDADVKTIAGFDNELYRQVEAAEFVTGVYRELIKNIAKRIQRSARNLSADVVNEESSYPIQFKTDLLSATSNMIVSEDSIKVDVVPTDVSIPTISANNITISAQESPNVIRQANTTFDYKATGDKTAPFRWGISSPLTLEARTDTKTSVDFTITARVDATSVNNVLLEVGSDNIGIIVDIYTSEDGISYRNIGKYPMRNSIVRAPASGDVKYVRVVITTDIARDRGNYYLYKVSLKNVLLSNVTPPSTAYYETQLITTDFNIRNISLIVDERKPNGVTTNYYVRTDDEDDWYLLNPANRDSTNNIFSTEWSRNSVKDIVTASTNGVWENDGVNPTYGDIDLYNVLCNTTYVKNGDYSIELIGGTDVTDTGIKLDLAADPEAKINWEEMELYRGIGDYRKVYHDRTLDNESSPLIYAVTQDGLGNVNPIYLRISQTERVSITDNGTTKKIVVDDYIYKQEISGEEYHEVEIRRENGEIVSDPFSVKFNQILFDDYDLLNNDIVNEPLFVTYTTLIDSDNYVVDSDSIIVNDGVKNIPSVKYKWDDTNTRIDLEGSQDEYPSYIYISFNSYKQIVESYPVYETNLFLQEETDIKIIPFTSDEIDAGNFHMVDGENASKREIIKLSKGWHFIQSTNPFVRSPYDDKDINALSGSWSRAALITENNYIRAYKEPLRIVSVFKLANEVKPFNKDHFAVEIVEDDNGDEIGARVLINRIPEYITKSVEDSNSILQNVEGLDLTCKRSIIDDTYNFVRYEIIPETFEVRFLSSKQPTNTIAVQVEIINDNNVVGTDTEINEIIVNNLY